MVFGIVSNNKAHYKQIIGAITVLVEFSKMLLLLNSIQFS